MVHNVGNVLNVVPSAELSLATGPRAGKSSQRDYLTDEIKIVPGSFYMANSEDGVKFRASKLINNSEARNATLILIGKRSAVAVD